MELALRFFFSTPYTIFLVFCQVKMENGHKAQIPWAGISGHLFARCEAVLGS